MALPLDAGSTLDFLADLCRRSTAAGADAADAVLAASRGLAIARRLGQDESTERAEGADLGLRVFFGRRQAVASTADFSPAGARDLVERAVAMARVVPEDPYCGPADPALLAADWPDVESLDPLEPDVAALRARAAVCEDAARAVPGVANSEGAEASWRVATFAMASSTGFAGFRQRSGHSVSVSVLAGAGTAMERDYDWTGATFAEDLQDPAAVGRSAGERAVRRLNPRKMGTRQVPVVYDPRVSRSLLNHLSGAANGHAVARGTTFLKGKLDQRIMPESVSVIDDPLRARGPRSRPFDGEGLRTRRMAVVENGVLRTWFLDLAAARQLDLAPTGHATRSPSSPPSPTTSNLYMERGTVSREQLLADVADGLYVTELIGFGVNGVTGDYSRGASGFWIEGGALAFPVSEITIAGNLLSMFQAMQVADDLKFEFGTDAPTIRIDGMTVAGR